MADKKAYTVRIDTDLLDKVKALADDRGETVTDTFENALKSYLKAPDTKSDTSTDSKEIERLKRRISRIELELSSAPPQDDQPGDLITIEEMEALTGYTKSTLSTNLSKLGIKAIEQIGGNRGGLYSKDEVLQKIGIRK